MNFKDGSIIMISFILYEDEDQMRKIYKKVILRVMGPQNKSYHLVIMMMR